MDAYTPCHRYNLISTSEHQLEGRFSLNYQGMPGLELGGGNITLNPSVASSKSVIEQASVLAICSPWTPLPELCCLVSKQKHGVSLWANCGRIDVQLKDGSPKSFFIKVVSSDVGAHMANGEFESISAIHRLLPEFPLKPLAWGTYETVPTTHFFPCEFRDMSDKLPDPLHLRTIASVSRRIGAMAASLEQVWVGVRQGVPFPHDRDYRTQYASMVPTYPISNTRQLTSSRCSVIMATWYSVMVEMPSLF